MLRLRLRLTGKCLGGGGQSVGVSDTRRITNFIVVEITPIGIQNIGWKFWIVWTVSNAVFLPVLYFLYPETGVLTRVPIVPAVSIY